MSLRFFRRVHLAPGFTLNLSKRGASLSAGERGVHARRCGNVYIRHSTHGTRETVGLPGTGISYSAAQHRSRGRRKAQGGIVSFLIGCFILYLFARVVIAMAFH
jgi:Protein of unknown function (DUF4236)